MQLPFRPKQQMKQLLQKDEPLYLTKEGIEKFHRRLKQIAEVELPQAIEDVRRTGEFGDFSENAEYQEAKWRMRRLRDQQTSITEKLKISILIETTSEDEGMVQMGSRVCIKKQTGEAKSFQIVGPEETDPLKGRLSFKSPLGARLMGRTVGEEVTLSSPSGETVYQIISIDS
ncbi:GreA/GreB family elongation factor [Candidatus Uhrbacteria bacterium]|nr:GreA/GreB family elongation factor [Candidatus Uhrbacteria bacterium]